MNRKEFLSELGSAMATIFNLKDQMVAIEKETKRIRKESGNEEADKFYDTNTKHIFDSEYYPMMLIIDGYINILSKEEK